jgi:hypothetical protein
VVNIQHLGMKRCNCVAEWDLGVLEEVQDKVEASGKPLVEIEDGAVKKYFSLNY